MRIILIGVFVLSSFIFVRFLVFFCILYFVSLNSDLGLGSLLSNKKRIFKFLLSPARKIQNRSYLKNKESHKKVIHPKMSARSISIYSANLSTFEKKLNFLGACDAQTRYDVI